MTPAEKKARRAVSRIVSDVAKVKADVLARAKKDHPDMTAAQLAAHWKFVKKQLGL